MLNIINYKKRSKRFYQIAIIIFIMCCIVFISIMLKEANRIGQDKSNTEKEYNINPTDLTETEITTEETYANTKYPLIARDDEQDISLYGVDTVNNTGVVLKHGDKIQFFDWTYMTPRFILPQISIKDFDNDGTDEIAFILDVASGTSVSVQELHLLELKENGNYEDNVFEAEDYVNQISKLVKYTADDEKITFQIDGKESTYQFSDIMENGIFEKLNYGSTVEYSIDDKIYIYIAIEFFFKDTVSPQYLPVFQAEVVYDDGFILKNPKIE